jgi:N-acetyl-alpha-D-muramate 1-phosphate uridylyltransferase
MLPVAILAGGLATRLGALTERRPKSLIEVAGRPFVSHQLQLLARQGVERVVLCLGHLGEMVQEFVGDGQRFGLRVDYSFDGEIPLGTDGALRRALPLLGRYFFVVYGDSYLQVPMRPLPGVLFASGLPALMCVLRNENRWDRSNVEFSADRVLHYSKKQPTPAMRYIDYGLSILTADLLSASPEREPFDLSERFESLAAEGQLAGHEVFERFYEIGSVQGLSDFTSFLGSAEAG